MKGLEKIRLFKTTLPPAAAPFSTVDLYNGLRGIINGSQEIKRFEKEIKDYFDVRYCFFLSSGRAAMTLILQALHDLAPHRDEVIIPAYTCYSVPASIIRAGLNIRLCDINEDTLDFDFDRLERLISFSTETGKQKSSKGNRVLCIMPTDLFGFPADVEQVKFLIQGSGVTVVEDAAQAFGGENKGKKMGVLGDVGFFSLGRGKSLSTVDGGIIVTNRDDIGKQLSSKIRLLPKAGILDLAAITGKAIGLRIFLNPLLFWIPLAIPSLQLGQTIYNYKFPIRSMVPFQAGLARNWMHKVTSSRFQRKRIIDLFRTQIPGELQYRRCAENEAYSNLIRFPIKVDNADNCRYFLKKCWADGLGVMPGYPSSVEKIKELKQTFHDQKHFPAADRVSRQLVTLPVHDFVQDGDVMRIINCVTALCRS